MSGKIEVKSSTGIVSTGAYAINTIINNNLNETPSISSAQVTKAIKRINVMNELTKEQKEYLISIVNDAKTAEDEVAKQSCKNSFQSFMKGLGKTSEKVLSIFADLATVAAFFSIGIAMPR